MTTGENLENVVNSLFLGNSNIIREFPRDWILNSPGATKQSIETIYSFLKLKGLSDDKIASRAQLLGMDPETIDRNYNHHVGLLRQNLEERTSGKELLINQAQLLGISPETINANVQFLHYLGIDYSNAFLLGTKPQTKRKKMAWMLRELFDYATLLQEQKKGAIDGLYSLIMDNPGVLVNSINTLEKTKDKLKQSVQTKYCNESH